MEEPYYYVDLATGMQGVSSFRGMNNFSVLLVYHRNRPTWYAYCVYQDWCVSLVLKLHVMLYCSIQFLEQKFVWQEKRKSPNLQEVKRPLTWQEFQKDIFFCHGRLVIRNVSLTISVHRQTTLYLLSFSLDYNEQVMVGDTSCSLMSPLNLKQTQMQAPVSFSHSSGVKTRPCHTPCNETINCAALTQDETRN